ncbi:LOW QUALITY PROTEIN: hypothetical protein ColTof4_13301 [Colletotrichum tofieldiae]|nr:LOW QUALITY PROTEIN: hypothetical protein ColTof4_13301 [Colletotrichum tofieldiae]
MSPHPLAAEADAGLLDRPTRNLNRPRRSVQLYRGGSSSSSSDGADSLGPSTRLAKQAPCAPIPRGPAPDDAQRFRRQRRRHDGRLRRDGDEEEEAEPHIHALRTKSPDAPARGGGVDTAEGCRRRRGRIRRLRAAPARAAVENECPLGPDEDVLYERARADAGSAPSQRLDEQPRTVHHRRADPIGGSDDRETDDVGGSTRLETEQRGILDDVEPHKGPRARKERRDPQREHRPPTAQPGRPGAGEVAADVALRRASRHDHVDGKTAPALRDGGPPLLETARTLPLLDGHHDNDRIGNKTDPDSEHPQLARLQQASPTSPPRQPPKPTTLRPAFNTLQQHYSPAKSLAPKPLTATYLAAPSPSKLPANVALTAETARLQTELLQLHLLHRDLPQTTAEWHASARAGLAARHASLGTSSAGLARLEADAAERLNVAALRRWAQPPPGARGSAAALEHRVQRLDALLTALWSLDAPGGKHNRLVRAFERWASALPDLEAARARAEDSADPSALLDANADVRFGGGLDARWKEEAAALARKLGGWDAQLRELEYAEVGEDEGGGSGGSKTQVSSLKRMLDGCGSLVRDMLDELAVMEEIEAAAVERETEWIKRMNREGDDGRGKDTPRAGAVWRVI